MVHFIIGKFPNMEKMRETFVFLAEFLFSFNRYLDSVSAKILRIRLCNRKYLHL